MCTPGTTMCTSDVNIATCTSSGQWGPATPCFFACASNVCTGVCSPGATQCLGGDQPQQCQMNGQWADNGPLCSGGCNSGCGVDAGGMEGGFCGGDPCSSNGDCCAMAPSCPNNGGGTGNCTNGSCGGPGTICLSASNCCAPYNCVGADSGVSDGGAELTSGICQ